MKNFRILFFGDVVGPRAAEKLGSSLWSLRKKYGADMVIVNGENCAPGNGIDKAGADMLLSGGADVITTGNHVFKRFEADTLLDDEPRIIRPANYPPQLAGAGFSLCDCGQATVLVINLLGLIGMEPLACPFATADKILAENKGKYDISVIDFHAEATSEKKALLFYLDGRASALVGTHTHVETADEAVTDNGTAYITDVGMCGAENSVLGVKPECIIRRLTAHHPVKFELADGNLAFCGVLIEFDPSSGKALSIERLKILTFLREEK